MVNAVTVKGWGGSFLLFKLSSFFKEPPRGHHFDKTRYAERLFLLPLFPMASALHSALQKKGAPLCGPTVCQANPGSGQSLGVVVQSPRMFTTSLTWTCSL